MLFNVPNRQLVEIREATKNDETLTELRQTILDGWLESKEETPDRVQEISEIRDMLSEQEGIVLKGEQIFIPKQLQTDIVAKLHLSHLGYNSMLRRASSMLSWPGLNLQIKQVADRCEVCQKYNAVTRKK